MTEGYEGGTPTRLYFEDSYWTRAKLWGEEFEEAPEEMTIVFNDQAYTGKYGYSTYSIGYTVSGRYL